MSDHHGGFWMKHSNYEIFGDKTPEWLVRGLQEIGERIINILLFITRVKWLKFFCKYHFFVVLV